MKGYVGVAGILHIQRGSKDKIQHCAKILSRCCSDECPLFGEPRVVDTPFKGMHRCLEICEGRDLVFTEFTDKRQ